MTTTTTTTGGVPFTVAMTAELDDQLAWHLLRADGQEDVCLATYRPSTGMAGTNAVLVEPIWPEAGERAVHGHASFTGAYVMRAALLAAEAHGGLVIMHSHPAGRQWQLMSTLDAEAEASYSHLAHELTGLPLLGMTLAGDRSWSARRWSPTGQPTWGGAVRVVGAQLHVTFNDALRPPAPATPAQIRTVSAWGPQLHEDITRLKVLVVGVGSVGLDVAQRLAATGIANIGLMDFDTVEWLNLDRLVGATVLDALLGRPKIDVTARLVTQAATAADFTVAKHDLSICEPAGLAAALDYDVIFSCVDKPWPRAVLNSIAYADLIPVIDGGIHIDAFADGGMRSATWRAHVLRPGRPCLVCNGQLDPAQVPLDRDGLLDDPEYIKRSGIGPRSRQNVAALSAGVSSSLLSLFVSLVAAPGGQGEPGPLRYLLATHTMTILGCPSDQHCTFERLAATGDRRILLVGDHRAAHQPPVQLPVRVRVLGAAAAAVGWAGQRIDRAARKLLTPESD